MFHNKLIKIVWDFEIKFFGHCSIAFVIQRSFVDPWLTHTRRFYIIKNGLKMNKLWGLKLKGV
jgi:hypothetical protein